MNASKHTIRYKGKTYWESVAEDDGRVWDCRHLCALSPTGRWCTMEATCPLLSIRASSRGRRYYKGVDPLYEALLQAEEAT